MTPSISHRRHSYYQEFQQAGKVVEDKTCQSGSFEGDQSNAVRDEASFFIFFGLLSCLLPMKIELAFMIVNLRFEFYICEVAL